MSSLSNLEELILLATGTLQGEAYGVAIHDRLHAAGMPSSLGAIYSTLERLEHKGFVTSELGEASPSRGGKRKRVFRITARGKREVTKCDEVRSRLISLQGQRV